VGRRETVRVGDYVFCDGKGNEIHQLGIDFCTPQNNISIYESRAC